MSTVSSGIVGSVNQAALQSAQVSRTKDSIDHQATQQSQTLRRQLEAEMSTVEDFFQVGDDHLTVNEEKREQGDKKKRHKPPQQATAAATDSYDQAPPQSPAPAAQPAADGLPYGSLDVQA